MRNYLMLKAKIIAQMAIPTRVRPSLYCCINFCKFDEKMRNGINFKIRIGKFVPTDHANWMAKNPKHKY